jgi:hypothetical protein
MAGWARLLNLRGNAGYAIVLAFPRPPPELISMIFISHDNMSIIDIMQEAEPS